MNPQAKNQDVQRFIRVIDDIIRIETNGRRARSLLKPQAPAAAGGAGIDVTRESGGDRAVPFETISLIHYNDKHDAGIEHAAIHTGPYANELARSMNALAITIAADIYFRNGAYQPESEEGRKTLAHELTHAAQYEEGRTGGNASREELEAEAEQAEQKEQYDPDPYVPLAVGNKMYHVRKSKRAVFIKLVAGEVKQYVRDRRYYMDEERYLSFLRAYEKWLKGK